VGGGDHGLEAALDPGAIVVGDGERGQELDRVAGVTGDLDQDALLLEQRDGDRLRDEALVRRFQQPPARSESR